MMSSLAGLRGSPGLSAYSATKGAVRLFAKSIAMECAAAGDGIRVNSVHPGIIDTPIWGKIPTGRDRHRPERADRSRGARQGCCTARPCWSGRGDRQRRAVSGLRCLACYVTGSELVIDGGMNAGARAAAPQYEPTSESVKRTFREKGHEAQGRVAARRG